MQRSIAQVALGSAAIALLTYAGYRLQITDATAALIFLFVIVILSLRSSLTGALIVSIFAVACLDYYFTPPLFRVRISESMDVVALVTFSTTAFVITRLMGKVRQSFEKIQAEM